MAIFFPGCSQGEIISPDMPGVCRNQGKTGPFPFSLPSIHITKSDEINQLSACLLDIRGVMAKPHEGAEGGVKFYSFSA